MLVYKAILAFRGRSTRSSTSSLPLSPPSSCNNLSKNFVGTFNLQRYPGHPKNNFIWGGFESGKLQHLFSLSILVSLSHSLSLSPNLTVWAAMSQLYSNKKILGNIFLSFFLSLLPLILSQTHSLPLLSLSLPPFSLTLVLLQVPLSPTHAISHSTSLSLSLSFSPSSLSHSCSLAGASLSHTRYFSLYISFSFTLVLSLLSLSLFNMLSLLLHQLQWADYTALICLRKILTTFAQWCFGATYVPLRSKILVKGLSGEFQNWLCLCGGRRYTQVDITMYTGSLARTHLQDIWHVGKEGKCTTASKVLCLVQGPSMVTY